MAQLSRRWHQLEPSRLPWPGGFGVGLQSPDSHADWRDTSRDRGAAELEVTVITPRCRLHLLDLRTAGRWRRTRQRRGSKICGGGLGVSP